MICNLKTERIAKCFFGTSKIADKLIMTSIEKIFSQLREVYGAKKVYDGWYKACLCEINQKDYFVVNVPVGQPSEDVFKILSIIMTEKYFFGYCGGLIPELSIGDLVQDKDNHRFFESIRKVRVQTANSLFDQTYNPGAEVVEMELEYAKRHLSQLSSILIVSDLPLTKPFYDITPQNKIFIGKLQSDFIKSIGDLL